MSGGVPVRIKVTPTWDEVRLELPADTPVSELKRRVLAMSFINDDPERYIVKFRGAQVLDETRSLAQAGIGANAPLIILNRRRQPVR